nr:MAG TPA: hypothetical protein [Caudoviricetes sp.]
MLVSYTLSRFLFADNLSTGGGLARVLNIHFS